VREKKTHEKRAKEQGKQSAHAAASLRKVISIPLRRIPTEMRGVLRKPVVESDYVCCRKATEAVLV
jgi:hypothetical protein